MRKTVPAIFVLSLLVSSLPASSSLDAQRTPWWEQGKTRWFWGQWSRFQSGADKVPWDEVMQNLRTVGATVFVDDGMPLEDQIKRASVAHKCGLKYFCMRKVCEDRPIAEKIGARLAVNRYGRTSLEEQSKGMRFDFGAHVPCPLDEKAVEEWLLKPSLQAARSGVVDGLQIDWESYGATSYDQLGDYLCYCDQCFVDYLAGRKLRATVARGDRYDWLRKRNQLNDYLRDRRDRLRELYSRVAAQVRKVNPEFVFAAYPDFTPGEWENSWRLEGAALGLNSPPAPFFVIDASHYNPNHNAPWWESGYTSLKKLGLKHILGTWTGGIFGDHPEIDVSATQWMYDAAISHDGYWVWFEHAFGPTDYQAYRAAQKRISATESNVGDFLMRGKMDNRFACAVEQSGNPALDRNLLQRAYHLGMRHLVRINNVNTDKPVSVLLRFGSLAKGSKWVVSDPVLGLRFTTGDRSIWTTKDLFKGVLLAMEQRSEAWLLLSPVADAARLADMRTISGDTTRGHPDRPKTDGPMPTGSTARPETEVLYSRQYPLNYVGGSVPSINPVLGTKICAVEAGGNGGRDLYAIKGDCWSPVFSTDRTRAAFSCYVNGRGQIYVVNADGSNPRNLSNNPYCDTSPTWSPDGKRIAFVSDREGDWEIYVMNADGAGQRRLTRSPGINRSPSWSPDGRTIAFESDRDGDFNVYLIGADGTGERVLVDRAGNEYEPTWSPDGSRIAFTGSMYGYHRDVLVVDVRSGNIEHTKGLTYAAKGWWQYTNVHSIGWSPDGKRIAGAFEQWDKSGVFIASLDPVGLKQLVVAESPKPKPGGSVPRYQLVGGWYWDGRASRRWLVRRFDSVQWAPDGKRIIFRSDMDPSGYEFLYTVAEDGTGLTRLGATLNPSGPNNRVSGGDRLASDPSALSRSFDGSEYDVLIPRLRKVADLPVDGWKFKCDPNGLGISQGYWKPDFSEEGMPALRVDKMWDDQGYGRLKEGWYRLRYRCPELPERGRVFLRFGAVDESAWLYIDGKLAAYYDPVNPGATWDKPALLEVTRNLTGGKEQSLVVRVKNSSGAGGLWRPITLMVENEAK